MIVTRKGIDISKWNPVQDAKAAKESGVDFVILREGHGFTTDVAFFENVQKFRKADIDIAGVYHFAYATNAAAAKKEAQICLDNVKEAGLKPDSHFIIFYDFEYDTVNECKKVGVTLTKKECNEHTQVFCETIKEAGYQAGVYFNLDYYRNWYDHDLLNKYHKWYADWRVNAKPLSDCVYHQYASTGIVPGIVGNVDMNNCYCLFGPSAPAEEDLVAKILKGVIAPLIEAGYDYESVLEKLASK